MEVAELVIPYTDVSEKGALVSKHDRSRVDESASPVLVARLPNIYLLHSIRTERGA